MEESESNTITRPESIGDQVYRELRRRLRSGVYPPLQRLTETGLASALGVSRTPVREAIGALTRIGLLVPHAGGGVMVPELAPVDVEEIFEARSVIEPYVAEVAAERHSDEQRQVLEEALAREVESVEKDEVSEFIEANAAFRDAVFEMAGNTRLGLCTEVFREHIHIVRRITLGDPAVRQIALEGHQRLFEAISRRDGLAAREAMRVQLVHALEQLKRALD